jgi:hypothetical protein
MTTFVNLTPHSINIHCQDGSVMTLPPSGDVARVSTVDTALPNLGGVVGFVSTSHGDVTGLPDAVVADQYYIVSGMVASATSGRNDVVSPGALVRDDNGRPIGCSGLRSSL